VCVCVCMCVCVRIDLKEVDEIAKIEEVVY